MLLIFSIFSLFEKPSFIFLNFDEKLKKEIIFRRSSKLKNKVKISS